MKKKILIFFCVLGLTMVTGAQASGLLTLYDFGTNTSINIPDQSGIDLNTAVGQITWSGILGVWNINVSTGISEKPIPSIDLVSVNHSTGPGTLDILYGDGLFNVGNTALMSIGGTSDNGTVANWALFDGTIIHTFTGLTGAFADSFTGAINPNNPTTLIELVQISHTGAGFTSFDARLNTVPVPPTALLLGGGLLGLVGLGWRRRRS